MKTLGTASADNLATWLFEEGSFAPAAKLTAQGAQSVVCDHLGTPLTMYDGKGKATWEMSLDAYGGVRQGKGQAQDCPFRFQGQYEDVETGLYYNRFRYYDPEVGTYISQDPIRLRGGKAFYGYVSNTISSVDPLGLVCETVTPTDVHAFGGATQPRAPRAGKDIPVHENGNVESQANQPWPSGASTTTNPEASGLTGHYHTLPKGTSLPEGLGIKADGKNVGGPRSDGHHTIFPTQEMPHSEFQQLFQNLPWVKGGKI